MTKLLSIIKFIALLPFFPIIVIFAMFWILYIEPRKITWWCAECGNIGKTYSWKYHRHLLRMYVKEHPVAVRTELRALPTRWHPRSRMRNICLPLAMAAAIIVISVLISVLGSLLWW